MIFLLLSCLLSLTTAAAATGPPLKIYSGNSNNHNHNNHNNNNSPEPSPETLLVDTRLPVFAGGHWQIMSDEDHRRDPLQRKVARRAGGGGDNNDDDENDGDGAAATSTIELPVDTSAAAKPLPSPFDGALAANFSADNGGACPNFINQFLSDPKFKDCYPFSLLLEVSLAT